MYITNVSLSCTILVMHPFCCNFGKRQPPLSNYNNQTQFRLSATLNLPKLRLAVRNENLSARLLILRTAPFSLGFLLCSTSIFTKQTIPRKGASDLVHGLGWSLCIHWWRKQRKTMSIPTHAPLHLKHCALFLLYDWLAHSEHWRSQSKSIRVYSYQFDLVLAKPSE